MGLTLEVTYESVAGLLHEHDTQLKLGGYYARIAAPPGLPPLAEATLVLAARGAPTIRLKARVTVANADSICLEIAPEERIALGIAMKAASSGPAGGSTERTVRLLTGAPAAEPAAETSVPVVEVEVVEVPVVAEALEVVEVVAEAVADPEPPSPEADDGASPAARARATLGKRIAAMSVGQKVQMAVKGEPDERVFLMRDRTAAVQCALLRNPRVGLDEVTALARGGHLAAETAEALAKDVRWSMSHPVMVALVRNPKTPLSIAITLVGRLQQNDLRVIAKGGNVRPQVAAAAKKRLIG